MADEHLKNVDELQSYFVKRTELILKSKGKKLIGWDEILEGGLAPEATVMSWRGMKGGIDAAKMNHHVVMTPWDYCYLDLYQGETSVEPPPMACAASRILIRMIPCRIVWMKNIFSVVREISGPNGYLISVRWNI